jgi:hypothetical protein
VEYSTGAVIAAEPAERGVGEELIDVAAAAVDEMLRAWLDVTSGQA